MIDAARVRLPDDTGDAFASVIALRRLAASFERATVDKALAEGWTWAHIGDALGMSAQAAHKRLAPSKRTTTRLERAKES